MEITPHMNEQNNNNMATSTDSRIGESSVNVQNIIAHKHNKSTNIKPIENSDNFIADLFL